MAAFQFMVSALAFQGGSEVIGWSCFILGMTLAGVQLAAQLAAQLAKKRSN